MKGLLRNNISHKAGSTSYSAFREYYSNGDESNGNGPKWHHAVTDLYYKAVADAFRVLKNNGVMIVKYQDEVSAGKQWLTHIEIVIFYQKLGFYTKDLFVVVRQNRASVSRLKKTSPREKNHSYFFVFVKNFRKK
ncbi:MAG: hypothetical protein Pg6C_04110 [Treponemataceae bacterium]|nr:MAG: hypothetical protein Pg6C_04110 [Treponemataceae bacterium]